MPVGRPPKYATEEERQQANKEQARIRQRKYRARKMEEKKKTTPRYKKPGPKKERMKFAKAAEGDHIEWVSNNLIVPSGPLRGENFKLPEWQSNFINEALKPGIREAALCVARKNGKTGLVAAICLMYLAGPLNRPDWRGIVTSLTADLAIELKNAILLTAKESGIALIDKKSPRPGSITGFNGAYVQILAADKGTGHAKGADLAIIDEAGLLQENQRGLWNAMLSSTSGRDGKLMLISILGDGPMMAELRERQDDPAVCWHGYTTELTDDFEDEKIWHQANPGLKDGIKSFNYMKDTARRAAANTADMAAFRAYDLNSPTNPDRELLVTMEQYKECKKTPPSRKGPCVIGIDLGGSSSMTAAAAYWPEVDRLEVKCALPGIPDIHSRSMSDGVGNRYQRMVDEGTLKIYPGVRTTPVQYFLEDFILDKDNVVALVADRYRQSEAEDVFNKLNLIAPAIWRGQGWQDASQDVRAFQRAVISRRLRVGQNLALESAIAESALAIDPAGNQKLDKSRAKSRIDAASAAVLAVGEGERYHARPAHKAEYYGVV